MELILNELSRHKTDYKHLKNRRFMCLFLILQQVNKSHNTTPHQAIRRSV